MTESEFNFVWESRKQGSDEGRTFNLKEPFSACIE